MTRRFAAVSSAAALGVAAALSLTALAPAQITGPRGGDQFRDVSVLKPPAGQRAAILVFEDMECPGCAGAHPIELKAAAQYHVPIVRYDFPLQMHLWSRDAAVFARYLQDKVNPRLADDYRTALFAQQVSIGSKDDLQNFNRKFMQVHGQNMPFVVDPTGALAVEVMHDQKEGERLNVTRTPTLVVVTPTRYQVVAGNETGSNDPNDLFRVLDSVTHGASTTQARTVRPAAAAKH